LRFAGELTEEGRPRGVSNAFCKTTIMEHAVDPQVLDANGSILGHAVVTILVREVLSTKLHAFMDTRYRFTVLLAFWRALRKSGVLPLHLCQGLLFLAKELGVLNFFSCGKRRKGFEPDVNAHLGLNGFKSFWFTFDRERDVPLKSGSALDRAGFDFPFDSSLRDHLETADLAEADMIIMGDGETTLREREAVRAMSPTKTGIARLLSFFEASKEGFHPSTKVAGSQAGSRSTPAPNKEVPFPPPHE
jgi:hypothetical protein